MAESQQKKTRAEALIESIPAPSAQSGGETVGLGVDLVDIERMRTILKRTPRFAKRIYTKIEQEYCESKATPEIHYATRFAAKEAVLKALGVGFAKGVDPQQVEVRRTVKGRPYVVLSGRALEIAKEQGVSEIPISLSYTHTQAIACAMAITPSSAVKIQKEDSLAALTRQFKELRGMLDNLDEPEPQAEDAQSDEAQSNEAQSADASIYEE